MGNFWEYVWGKERKEVSEKGRWERSQGGETERRFGGLKGFWIKRTYRIPGFKIGFWGSNCSDILEGKRIKSCYRAN